MGRYFEVTPTEIEGREALLLDVPEALRYVFCVCVYMHTIQTVGLVHESTHDRLTDDRLTDAYTERPQQIGRARRKRW